MGDSSIEQITDLAEKIGNLSGQLEHFGPRLEGAIRRLDTIAEIGPRVASIETYIAEHVKPGLAKVTAIDSQISHAKIGAKWGLKGWLLGIGGPIGGGALVLYAKSIAANIAANLP